MRLSLILALAAASMAGAALAQPRGGRPPMDPAARVKALDANSDGAVTKEEWRGPPERFDAIDTNHDGKISAAELAAAPRRGPPAQ